MNWIKARLNKDNFWNMIFWLSMTIGMAITEYLSSDNLIAGISIWSTLICVPLITKSAQSVKFDKRYGFFNCHGKPLKDSFPKNFAWTFFVAIGFMIIIGMFIDRSNSDVSISLTLGCFLFLLIPVLYFIYINCPISILFNKHIFLYTAQERVADLLARVPDLGKNTQSVTYISYHFHKKENTDRNQ